MEKDQKLLAAAAKHFEKFYESEVFSEIVNSFASVCELLKIQPGSFDSFYPELKVETTFYWGWFDMGNSIRT